MNECEALTKIINNDNQIENKKEDILKQNMESSEQSLHENLTRTDKEVLFACPPFKNIVNVIS